MVRSACLSGTPSQSTEAVPMDSDCAEVIEVLLGFRFDEQGSAGAQHVFGDAAAEPAGCRGRVDLVDVIWKR